MANLREYFDTDPRVITVRNEWNLQDGQQAVLGSITAKIAYDFQANAKYWYFYVPENTDLSGHLSTLFRSPSFAECKLGPEEESALIETTDLEFDVRQSDKTLLFTRRVILYLDFDLTYEDRAALILEARNLGYFMAIRDRSYAKKRSESEKPLAFISHDSRDKDLFVRDLANELAKNLCPVWYDEFSLSVGDSLRESIERGLRETKRCVVILSPHFLGNKGWGLAEFDSVFTREILEKKSVFLPVWLNVGVDEVYRYSPRLADKVGVPASRGVAEVARLLAKVIKASD